MDTETKICAKCKLPKERYLFCNSKSSKDGKQYYCKSCHAATARADYKANPEKEAARKRAWQKANPEKVNANVRAWQKANRAYRYNLTNEEYQELLEAQNNSCKICLKSFTDKAPHVDHDHVCCPGKKSCGKCIRGLLCGNCNKMLGFSADSAEILQSAVNYLDKYSQMQYTNQSEEIHGKATRTK
jgi:hypothetical protein